MNSAFLISVIVSTYNRPQVLSLVLESLMHQSDQNFEVIVADDGSGKETEKVVQQFQKQAPVPVRHVWHEDLGFRLARIRNLAVQAARGEYLIFLDGDCIPSFEFVENHRQLAESGWVVNGQRVLASEAFTQQLVSHQQILQEWTYSYFKNLATQQSVNRAFPVITTKQTWFRKLQKTKWERIRGCNFALWKSDYLAVNGSDESFQGWGSEDKDLVVRLLNHGCFIKSGQLACCVLHLWHNEAKRNNAEKNLNIVKERRLKKVTLPKVGLK